MTPQHSTKAIVIEAAVATVLALAMLALANQPALGLGVVHPHPIWLVILVLAARYGARGLVVAAPLAWGALALASAAFAPPGLHASWLAVPARLLATLAAPAELGALCASVLVGWVASVHERTARDAASKLEMLERRAGVDSAAIEELRRAALALRVRNDRLDVSLTFLRGVARRLEGSDPVAAAEAALELAIARLGARAAAVFLHEAPAPTRDGHGVAEALVAFAVQGAFSPDGRLAIEADGTVGAALRTGAPTRAMDLPSGGPGDSDLAAPIIDPRRTAPLVHGVLAVRGVPRGGVSGAALRDLAVIAEWSAEALSGAKSDRGAPARLTSPSVEVVAGVTPFPPKAEVRAPQAPEPPPVASFDV
jgi:hypothetical protein